MNPRSYQCDQTSRQGGRRGKGTFSPLQWLFLAVLLILPVKAALDLGWDWRWIAGYAGILGLVTYTTYAADKSRAQSGRWRVPEAHLHLLELLGGWPAAWVAQQRLRHKCAKRSYQVVFVLIILLHQAVALDAVLDWRMSGTLMARWARSQENSEVEIRRAIRL